MPDEPESNAPESAPSPGEPEFSSGSAEADEPDEDEIKRRDFLQKAGSVAVGGAIIGCPAITGLVAVADPLIKGSAGGTFVKLTVVDAIPADGTPKAFKVIADKVDAWTTYRDVPLGMVYVRRTPEGTVDAFNASCPHAGCSVEYRNDEESGQHYYCPCHKSNFALDGSIASPKTPALRGLDSLEIDKEKWAQGEVWVKFEKFKAGVAKKISIS